MPRTSQGALFLFTGLCVGLKLRRRRPSSHLLLLSDSPFEWRGVLMMPLRNVIYRACTWLPSFLCLGIKLLPRRLDGGWVCFYVGSLPISLFTGNILSGCLHALINVLGIALFTRLLTPISILVAKTLMYCVLSVRVGVLPPTPSTLYLGSYRSLYGTFTSLVVFRSMARFMMRLSLARRSLVTELSRARGWFHLHTTSCLPHSGAWRRHTIMIKE